MTAYRIGKNQHAILERMERGWKLWQDERGCFHVVNGGHWMRVDNRACLSLHSRGYVGEHARNGGKVRYALTEQGKEALK